MEKYISFIENSLRDFKKDRNAFLYKRKVLDAMNERADEVRRRGLQDEEVVQDLVVSEMPDLVAGYKKYCADERFKHRVLQLPKFSIVYVLALVLAFLAVGFGSEKWMPGNELWHPAWLIIEVGVSALLIGILLFFVPRLAKSRWYFVARLCVAGSVMIAAQAIFLLIRIPLQVMNAYLLVIAAPAVMLLCDLLLATLTRQRMLLLSYLLYIPAIAALVYALLGITQILAWDPGWHMMIGAVLLDILLVVGIFLNSRRYAYKPEEEEDA